MRKPSSSRPSWASPSEIEFGRMLSPNVGLFGRGLFGVGSDRPFDWGIAAGVRFNF